MTSNSTRDDLIPNLKIPEAMNACLQEISDIWKSSFSSCHPLSENKGISASPLPANLMATHELFTWICNINEVVDNLNLIIKDTTELPVLRHLLPGSVDTRVKLLVRMYYYEFYRFRELFNTYLKCLERQGLITKNDFNEGRREFHETFKVINDLRNTLVHSSVRWEGYEHCCLTIKSRMLEWEEPAACKLEATYMLNNAIERLTGSYTTTFIKSGKFVVDILQILVDESFVELLGTPLGSALEKRKDG